MASEKLSELPKLTTPADKDQMYVVDNSEALSKSIDLLDLVVDYVEPTINSTDPFIINISSGTSTTYTNVKNKIYLKWSGGAGTHDLILPSAVSGVRKIEIISNGTLSSNHKVHIQAPAGESINGIVSPGYYTLNKAYHGLTAWSDGSEWIVFH
tara:strand:+ start:1751 stop:2212 length:462 start_codon:yes stop_codon:yes gene_type:complete